MPVQTRDATIRVASVQFRSSRDISENLARIESELEKLAAQGVQAAAFPECAATAYDQLAIEACTPGELVDAENRLSAMCARNKIACIMGIPYFEDGVRYNGALVWDSKGKLITRYAKIQLAGEKWCESGDHLAMFKLDGVTCSVIVCHDSRYPELVRLPAIAGAQVIFYISCESDITAESKLGPYRAQVQARAVENSVYVVQSNAPVEMVVNAAGEAVMGAGGSHGESRIVNPEGNLISEAGYFTEETLIADLDLDKATRHLAIRSTESRLLRSWWESGLKLVPPVE